MSAKLTEMAARYGEAMAVRGQTKETLAHKRTALARFAHWCAERELVDAVDVTRLDVERYQRWLFHYRRDDGTPLTTPTQHNHLTVLKLFFRWLVRQGLMLHNPAADLDMPRLPQQLPRHVLTAEEVESTMVLPDVNTPLGLRDRAMLEVLYSTGIRRAELLMLQVVDVDLQRKTLLVRMGKNRKDRVVPLGERAMAWLQKYLGDARPTLVRGQQHGHIFVGEGGAPLNRNTATTLVRTYVKVSGTEKVGACHLLRHTAATLMLEGGADIRYIQAMLGHAKLSTTEVYTRVAIGKLIEVHAATHPGAPLGKRPDTAPDDDKKD